VRTGIFRSRLREKSCLYTEISSLNGITTKLEKITIQKQNWSVQVKKEVLVVPAKQLSFELYQVRG